MCYMYINHVLTIQVTYILIMCLVVLMFAKNFNGIFKVMKFDDFKELKSETAVKVLNDCHFI